MGEEKEVRDSARLTGTEREAEITKRDKRKAAAAEELKNISGKKK